MIRRTDIQGSKSNVVPVVTYLTPLAERFHVFTVGICTENELTSVHLRYHSTDVPPQPDSSPDNFFRPDQPWRELTLNQKPAVMQVSVQRNKQHHIKSNGFSKLSKLPLLLHLLSHFTKSDWSQARQGPLSPLIIPSPFPWLGFRKVVDRDSGNLVKPPMLVTNQNDKAFKYLKGAIVTPAVYSHLDR